MEGKNNLKKLKVATQTHGQRIRVALLLEIPWLGYEISKKLKNWKVIIRSFLVSKV